MKILIEYNFLSAIQLIVERFPSLDLNLKDENGYTVFHYVAKVKKPNETQLKILKLLVFSFPNSNINSRDNNNFTPYQLAWCSATVETIKFFQTIPNCEPLTATYPVYNLISTR